MNPLEVLDLPRQSLYGLGRSIYHGITGEGTADDIVSALPGALGLLGGAVAAPFTGGSSIPIGMALAAGAQGAGRMMDDERFNAATPSDLLKAMGYDDADPLSTFLTQMATDPMTYLTGAGAIKGGSKIASMFGKAAPAAEAAAAGKTVAQAPAALAALESTAEYGNTAAREAAAAAAMRGQHAAMLTSPERQALESMAVQPLESTVPIGPFRPNARMRGGVMTAPTGSSLDIGFEPGFEEFGRAQGTMVPSDTQRSALLEALAGGEGTMDIPRIPTPARTVPLGSPELTSEALGAADRTMPGGYVLANQKKAIRTFEDAPKMVLRQGKEAFAGGEAEARRLAAIREALAQGYSLNLPEQIGFRANIGM